MAGYAMAQRNTDRTATPAISPMRPWPGSRNRRGMDPGTTTAVGNGKQAARILIVDDHEISRAALRALLRTEGIDVADVRTGDAAITATIAFHPDVVIVDVTPADPAGFHIARRLRALPDAPAVVLTSSHSRCRFGSQLGHYL